LQRVKSHEHQSRDFFPFPRYASTGERRRRDCDEERHRFTCEIKETTGRAHTSLDYVDGTISVQWSKVARLESNQLFLVQTQGGSIYTASLKTPETPADEPVKIEVVEAPAKEVVLARSEIVGLGQTSEAFWHRFSVSLSSGLNFSKSNNTTQYNFSSEVRYTRARWGAKADFSSALSDSNGAARSTWNQLYRGGPPCAGTIGSMPDSEFPSEFPAGNPTPDNRWRWHRAVFKNTNRARISIWGDLPIRAQL
jgi:hypothetical protein